MITEYNKSKSVCTAAVCEKFMNIVFFIVHKKLKLKDVMLRLYMLVVS
jgi:hypothetical protein